MNVTLSDKLLYQRLKMVVAENLESSFKAWEAIKQIKDEKLYLQEFKTWDEFCHAMCKLTPQHVNRLISACELIKSEPAGSLLTNERQAREIVRISPERRQEVVERASSNGPLTARSIKTAAQAEIALDSEGYRIPDQLIPCFNRTNEIRELQHHIAIVGRALKKAYEDDDSQFAEVNTTGLVSDLRKISGHLNCAIPYAVCYQCQGHPETGCVVCNGRGWISKYRTTTVPEELRAIRAKGVKK